MSHTWPERARATPNFKYVRGKDSVFCGWDIWAEAACLCEQRGVSSEGPEAAVMHTLAAEHLLGVFKGWRTGEWIVPDWEDP